MLFRSFFLFLFRRLGGGFFFFFFQSVFVRFSQFPSPHSNVRSALAFSLLLFQRFSFLFFPFCLGFDPDFFLRIERFPFDAFSQSTLLVLGQGFLHVVPRRRFRIIGFRRVFVFGSALCCFRRRFLLRSGVPVGALRLIIIRRLFFVLLLLLLACTPLETAQSLRALCNALRSLASLQSYTTETSFAEETATSCTRNKAFSRV